jgi:transposase
MSIEIARRVKALEAKVAELEKKAAEQIVTIAPEVEKSPRSMCPKCGVKPNHFFHVKNCRGLQEEQKNADEPGRNPGAT